MAIDLLCKLTSVEESRGGIAIKYCTYMFTKIIAKWEKQLVDEMTSISMDLKTSTSLKSPKWIRN